MPCHQLFTVRQAAVEVVAEVLAAEVLQAVDLAVAVAVAGKEVKVSGTANACTD